MMETDMTQRQFVRRLAGIVVLTGLLGGYFITEYMYLITAFAGLNLLQSSFTGICPPEGMYDDIYETESDT